MSGIISPQFIHRRPETRLIKKAVAVLEILLSYCSLQLIDLTVTESNKKGNACVYSLAQIALRSIEMSCKLAEARVDLE